MGELFLQLLIALARAVLGLDRREVGRRRVVPSQHAARTGTLARAQTGATPRAAVDRAAVESLTTRLRALAAQAHGLDARCAASPLGASLLPTMRGFVLPALARAEDDARHASTPWTLARVTSLGAYLDRLLQLFGLMADQRSDPRLNELIDDADALAAACYQPVLEYCRMNGVPLSSDRTATVFGDGCSPWLGRLDDPTGLAILHLPWEWLAEVQRWPAIAHEVGHDFYDSVPGLDEELLRRQDLLEAAASAELVDGANGVGLDDVRRVVARWRHELIADAFGVMMLGPAYALTTAALFASPGSPAQALQVEATGGTYDVHPPGHVRVAVVCRLLLAMGYGALAEGIERRWRTQHGDPDTLLLPTTSGHVRVEDEPFIACAASLTNALQRAGFAALKGIPLYSMPGFDFGPREQAASLRVRDAFLANTRSRPTDARLLIAGAVLAWAERPEDGARLLRAARLAVGTLALPVPRGAGAEAPQRRAESRRELMRDAVLLDALLTPPRASLLRR